MIRWHFKFGVFLLFFTVILSFVLFLIGIGVKAEEGNFASLKIHSSERSLLVNLDAPIESGSIVYKYRDDYRAYMYADNISDNDWVICVPVLKYDDYKWQFYDFDPDDIYAKKITDVCNKDGDRYILHDQSLISLYGDYSIPLGRVSDIILFNSGADGKVRINGVWRVVWSVKLNERVDRGETIESAVLKLRSEIGFKYRDVLDISKGDLIKKYSVYKHTDSIFKLLALANKVNNIYALTADDMLNPMNCVDIPRNDDYMLVKIADFDSAIGRWIPSIAGSSFTDPNFEKNAIEQRHYAKNIKYKNVPRFWSDRFLENNSSAIYDIVHKSSDGMCDFAIRVALVGNNLAALDKIPLIQSSIESELVKKYSNMIELEENHEIVTADVIDGIGPNSDDFSFLFKKTGEGYQILFWIFSLFSLMFIIRFSKQKIVYRKL